MSRPARALWIEILGASCRPQRIASRPARALWIEIVIIRHSWSMWTVEAREGLVD